MIGEQRTYIADVPDLLSVHGTLQSSKLVKESATLTATFRTGPPFPGTSSFVWTINCEKGEVQVSSESGPFLQSEASTFPVPLRVHYHASDEVHEIDWDWEEWQKEFLSRGRSIAKLYDLFSEGRLEEEYGGTLDEAFKRHKQLDTMLST